jgi:hypothetical protein
MDITAFEKPLSVRQPVAKRITGWMLTFWTYVCKVPDSNLGWTIGSRRRDLVLFVSPAKWQDNTSVRTRIFHSFEFMSADDRTGMGDAA